jgi:uncharacterized protein YjdB
VAGAIPTKTEAIRIVLHDQSEQVIGAPRVVTRPASSSPGQPARVLFTDLPPGPVYVNVSAHGTPSATDPPLSVGSASGEVVPGQRTVVMVEMFTTVATIEVVPSKVTLNVGEPRSFTAVAKDGQGQTLTGISFDWTSFDPGTVAIDPKTGIATGMKPGNATIFVQEEAGVHGSAGGDTYSPGLRASGQADVSVALPGAG